MINIIALRWTALMAALNLLWEIAQLPLYAIYEASRLPTIAYAVAHCTAGDVLIALASYAVAAAATRAGTWPLVRPVAGTLGVIAAAVVYTVFSEWFNVSVRGSWAYAEAMPQIFGIGLSPLLQWFVTPPIALSVTRKLSGAHLR